MEIVTYLLPFSYLFAIAACLQSVVRYALEYKKDKKKYRLYGAAKDTCLLVVFFVILVSMGPKPAWSGDIIKITIRSAVVGFAVFKFLFETYQMLTFIVVDKSTGMKNYD